MNDTCHHCGACCRSLLLDISGVDLLREPRWEPFIQKYKEIDYEDWPSAPDEVLFLVTTRGCPFLVDNECSIYQTRPDMCVAFRPIKDNRCAFNPECVFEYGERERTLRPC